ncbi:hypothetical protein [Bacillus sp. mrc49]|uniref:hypothetical protein n=1 Tax=Bacillus sp. mrc49 TaxID=2054913 RepID=UPI000C27C210|nr:hypothetical protein [Bacillus sp. mrc49]PJN90597.1 hypothetical protein CVN76_09575 [Bacillus sp. mrc49]PJN91200.1 hypothetical protein CVN76_06245 [Bacillus sp. mrc49]PJN91251.1 hypothetical protein CVN76_05955 [Bacillus sp. mrc49]
MFRKQQPEVIDFKTFMAGTYRKPKRSINTPIYSFMPSITVSSFLSPDVAGIYAVVLGVFAIGMLSHGLENFAASSGREELAWAIETVTRLAFTIGGFSSIAWFLLSL